MKLFIVILSFLTVVAAQEPSLSCRYYSFAPGIYGCELSINNPNGFNNFTEIEGIHLEGFTNSDVNDLYRRNGTTTNIPQIICETFPNLINFEFFNTAVTEIDDNSLSGCSRLTQIYLVYNRINSISENAFVNLREAVYINLADNLLSTLPENVFASQQNLTNLYLDYNSFNNLPSGIFRPLVNLQYLSLNFANITINDQWFTENSRLNYLNLGGNRITLSSNTFTGLEQLRYINLGYNQISQIPTGVFRNLPNLTNLELYGNTFTALPADAFPDLGQIEYLEMSNNPLETIDENAFRGLDNLQGLGLSSCRIRNLNSISFENLRNLTSLNFNFNEIEEIPPGTFASMPNLNYIGLWNNRLKTLRRNSFGMLTQLETLDLDGNIVNALDRAIIDDAVNLNTLYFQDNLCANSWFSNFLISRATYLQILERCFSNFRYIVDTTTEGDGVYSFFEGPQPGIVLRVQSDNEVQIVLTPFNFVWNPAVEIFLGSTNNTRSVIRINEETDVVTVPTPNIIQSNQWNDFRITWVNQNVLVFRSNETYPFMSYTMQNFFPVNFYGLRAVETRATWSVQPLE